MAAWTTGLWPRPIFAAATQSSPTELCLELQVPAELFSDAPDSRRPASVSGPNDAPGSPAAAVALAGRVVGADERRDDARDALSLPACHHLGSRLACSSAYDLQLRAVEERQNIHTKALTCPLGFELGRARASQGQGQGQG
eukprot:scaffold123254_cov60-Phaeocystis_antarctica.AAC.1